MLTKVLITASAAALLTACGGGDSSPSYSGEFTISGTISGLNSGEQITLQNKGDNSIIISSGGKFRFTTTVEYNGNYAVTISKQPVNQKCVISNGNGSGVVADVNNITINCSAAKLNEILVSLPNNRLKFLETKQLDVIQSLDNGVTSRLNSGYTSSSTIAACSFNNLELEWTFKSPRSYTNGTLIGYQTAKTNFQSLASRAQAGESYAISVLQASAAEFLGQSIARYASSVNYQNDLSLVVNTLTPSSAPALLATNIAVENSCALGLWNQFIFEIQIDNMSPVNAYNHAMAEYQNVFQRARYGNIEATWRYYEVAKQLNRLAPAYLGNAGSILVANLFATDAPIINNFQRYNSSVNVDSQGLATAVMLDNALITVCKSGLCASTLIAVNLE